MQNQKGYIHSFETMGTVDGPGIRTVVFFSGCSLRCQYCHNVDMQNVDKKTQISVDEVMEKILKNKEYYNSSNGGVTFSGGDPLFQSKFLLELLKRCKAEKIHTTVDTSLYTIETNILDEIIPYTDLFLVSLKHFDDEIHKKLTGVSNKKILSNLKKYFSSKNSPKLWLRYLVLPGYTDTKQNLDDLVKFISQINYEKFEILPYHKMGIEKWKKLDLKYELEHIIPPTKKDLQKIKTFLKNNSIL